MKKPITLLGCLFLAGCNNLVQPRECETYIHLGDYYGYSVVWHNVPQSAMEEYLVNGEGKKIKFIDYKENGTERNEDGSIDRIITDGIPLSKKDCKESIKQLRAWGILGLLRNTLKDKIKLAYNK